MTNQVHLLARLTIVAAAIVGLYFLGRLLGDVIFPVVFSLIAAYLLDPFVDFLERRGVRRTFGILLILIGGALAFLSFIVFFFPIVQAQIVRLVDRLPTLGERIESQFLPWIRDHSGDLLPADLSEAVASYSESLKNAIPSILKSVGKGLFDAVSKTSDLASSLLNLILIPIFTFYFLRDFDRIRLALVPVIPPRYKTYVLSRALAMDHVVGHWLRGQLQVAAILAVLYAVGFGIVFLATGLDIKTGIVVGILTGFLSVIPYVGALTGCVLSVLFALLDWHGIFPFVGIAIVFAAVQLLEGYVLTPRIVGGQLGISSVGVILALLVGGSLGGLAGLLFALPITAALKILFQDALKKYLGSPWFLGGAGKKMAGPRRKNR